MDAFHCMEEMQKLHASMEIVAAIHIAVSISFATIAFY
jgi:hypothetical protein